METGKVTIKDIARIAKVTPTTVSMALNNRPRVSEKTRRKILRIAEELNYQPDLIARGLRNKRTHTIGLMIKNIADPFYPLLAKGIGEKANELGYNVILCNVADELELKTRHLNMLRSKGTDGIITTTVLDGDPYIRPLVEDAFPFVTAVRVLDDQEIGKKIDSVSMDNVAGGYAAVEHLCRLGHDRIGIIAGGLKTSTASDRTAGAQKALRERGIRIQQKLIAECNFSRQQAGAATKKMLAMKNPPTAFFAEDDNMALGVRETILRLGLKIPQDIALVGFDNIDMAGLAGIELTTINQKIFEIGALSVKVLVDKIEKKGPPMVNKIVLQPELIIRKSCGHHPGGYPPG